MKKHVILAIDQGTTNSKAILVDTGGHILARGTSPVKTHYTQSGWVEQNAQQIWQSVLLAISSCRAAATDIEIVALALSNQRESVMAWHRQSGQSLGPVITWQCRRTAQQCEALKIRGLQPKVIERTGLPLSPLFSATKICWLLENCCTAIPRKDICIGTVDSWLIWQLSGGHTHATDRSNAARTQLFNITQSCWDEQLCDLFKIPIELLPVVQDSSNIFAHTCPMKDFPNSIPIAAAIGDSHAALFAHGAFQIGDGKITFGTGCSIMTIIPNFISNMKEITTTIAWSIHGVNTYALEGNILVSASILPWCADLLGLNDVQALLDLAKTVTTSGGVSLVPALTGLGAPHWDTYARGLISGLSFTSKPAHIARAAVDSLALQACDVFDNISNNTKQNIGRLFVDGGPGQSQFLMQMVADYLNHPIILCKNMEASALGAAYFAGLAIGFWRDLEQISTITGNHTTLQPTMHDQMRVQLLKQWQIAIKRATLRQ